MEVEVTSEELMLQAKNGDIHIRAQAFSRLVKRHGDHLLRYLSRKCGDKTSAQDLSQEIWLKLFDTRARYNVNAKFTHYLFKIAHNHFIDHYRRNKNKIRPISMEVVALAELSMVNDTELPDRQVEGQQTRQEILQYVSKLPDEQGAVFLLKEHGGLNIEEIADITDTSKETVKSRYRYAKEKLQSSMSGYE